MDGTDNLDGMDATDGPPPYAGGYKRKEVGEMSEQEQAGAGRCVDLTGEVCPMTFVKAKMHLDRLAAGEVLDVRLKDVETASSVVMSVKDEGHRVETVREENGAYRVVVRKV